MNHSKAIEGLDMSFKALIETSGASMRLLRALTKLCRGSVKAQKNFNKALTRLNSFIKAWRCLEHLIEAFNGLEKTFKKSLKGF